MSHFIRFRSAATILALLVTNALSGSGPTISGSTISGSTIVVASNNQPGAGAVSSVAAASSNISSPQAAELRSAGQRNASGATHAKPLTRKAVTITINALTNRHLISTYVYGGAYPQDAATITDSGLTEVRWGGDATSTYNWQLETYNAANDYYFEDYAAEGFGNGSDGN
ncbi:MAG: hypothetical protein WCB11_06780, partial [Terriglobales bacterium]